MRDIIQNSYFKVFNWSNSLRIQIAKFYKEVVIDDEDIRSLLSYKI